MKTTIKILVIEDDEPWSIFIESIIADANYQFLGTANTTLKAKKMIVDLMPDLIITDIMLKNNSIFDIFLELKTSIPTIFMTNHLEDEVYDLSKTISKSTFLVKPFHKNTLRAAINLLLDKYPITKLENQFIEVSGKHRQMLKIPYTEVTYIEAEGNHIFINLLHNKKYVRKKPLRVFMEELDQRFIRVHKSFIINTNFVKKVDLSHQIMLVGEKEVPIGRSYRPQVDKYLFKQL